MARALAGPGKKPPTKGGPSSREISPASTCFYPLPLAVRTWAPGGQTPLWTAPLTHNHPAALSGITPAGRLFMQTPERAYHSGDVVRVQRVLLRTARGKLLVIWDGAPIHRG